MKQFISHVLLFCLLLCPLLAQDFQVEQKELYDAARSRVIPIEIYRPQLKATHLPLVIINHGYTLKNSDYSFIAKPLCQQGYCVIAIQHDLPADSPLPTEGNLFEKRMPIWERGVQNILFVLSEIRNKQKIILIGHSNGGDIAMLLTSIHPQLVEKVISLDSLRMPFPTFDQIPILSLRAIDTKADKGVLPESGAAIIELKGAKHIDMYDSGPAEVKDKILSLIMGFLSNQLTY